jgi:hypothetical protein
MVIRVHPDPHALWDEYREIYPDAQMKIWTKPEGVEILAQVQIRQGDPYFWIYRPVGTPTRPD